MSNEIDEFTAALTEKIKNGNVTPKEIMELTAAYAIKPKRGRPPKKKLEIKKKSIGRPKDEKTIEMNNKIFGLWVMLSQVNMPKMQKRKIIADVSNKSVSVVDKVISRFHRLIDGGLCIAAYSKEDGKVLIMSPDEAEYWQARYEQGEDINQVLENSDYFEKIELQDCSSLISEKIK